MTDVRVLHVDDDKSLLGLASVMLERRGFDVVTVTDVERALETLDTETVDCVVSDYQMPGRDGLEFLELVREREPELPFVLFTGKGSEEVASDAIAAGVSDYLQKRTDPNQFEELANRVERVVRERRTAEGLSEGDRILTALVETLSGVVYRIRVPSEEIAFVGGQVSALTGYDAVAFQTGEVTWRDLVHDDDVDRVEHEVREALQEGRPFNATFRIRTRSGRLRRVSNRGRGVYDETGRPVAIEGFALDRSDGAYEAQVRELHASIRRLFAADSAEEVAQLTAAAARDVLGYPINVVRLYDEDRGVLRPAASTGRSDDSIDGDSAYPVDEGDDPMESGSYPATAFRTDRTVVVTDVGDDRAVPSSVESAMHLPLGGYGTLDICATEASSFESTDREVAGILAENAGIALERVVREGSLEAERDRLAALFENIPDPAVRVEFVEDDPIVEAVNPAFESTFGYAESAVVGELLDELIVPTGDEEGARECNERLQNGESLRTEVRRETADGIRDFLLHVIPQSREEGTAMGYAIYTEITEQRERERELARQNERLEEFTSVVSHDLRGPLNVAEGQLEIARATGAGESFDAVERAHDRMEARIEGLLELARHGRTIGETGVVDLASVTEIAWRGSQTGTADLEIEPTLPTIEADGERLCQLFENLFSNAVIHGSRQSPPRSNESTVEHGPVGQQAPTDGRPSSEPRSDGGEPSETRRTSSEPRSNGGEVSETRRVSRERSSSGGEVSESHRSSSEPRSNGGEPSETRRTSLERSSSGSEVDPDEPLTVTVGSLDDGFYVADDGVGIPSADRERLFEPGYSTHEDGMGFGLAIVRSIAEAHGWSVTVTDSLDGGARFEFAGVNVLDGDDGSATNGSGEHRFEDLY